MALQAHKLLRKVELIPAAHRVLFYSTRYAGVKKYDTGTNLKPQNQDLHLTTLVSYPQAHNIPLPNNVEDINAIETARFSPQRARDITSDVILTQSSCSQPSPKQDLSADNFIESYDCTGTISLNSAMQTNVPDPYAAKGKAPTHLNMPGGEWGRSDKYVAQDLQNSHYTNVKEMSDSAIPTRGNKGTYSYLQALQILGPHSHLRHYSTGADASDQNNIKKNDKVAKLKNAVKDYGATVVVFHVGISLISLGGFYLAVTSGIDLNKFSFGDVPPEVTGEVGAFVIAYAIHKMFAPVRISITLFCTPFIVRHLRRIGVLSKPKPPMIHSYIMEVA